MSAPAIYAPLMMSVAEFARLHGVGETVVRECIAGTSDVYPPLTVKRAKRAGTRGRGRIYITAEQAAAWRAALPDA